MKLFKGDFATQIQSFLSKRVTIEFQVISMNFQTYLLIHITDASTEHIAIRKSLGSGVFSDCQHSVLLGMQDFTLKLE